MTTVNTLKKLAKKKKKEISPLKIQPKYFLKIFNFVAHIEKIN